MMKLFAAFFALAVSCSVLTPSAHAWGWIYTDATYPLQATGGEVMGPLKVGKSESTNILTAVELGDAGIDKAAKQAGIKKIHHVDAHVRSIFIFFSKLTTTVYGE